jgi:hypothetical protein
VIDITRPHPDDGCEVCNNYCLPRWEDDEGCVLPPDSGDHRHPEGFEDDLDRDEMLHEWPCKRSRYPRCKGLSGGGEAIDGDVARPGLPRPPGEGERPWSNPPEQRRATEMDGRGPDVRVRRPLGFPDDRAMRTGDAEPGVALRRRPTKDRPVFALGLRAPE